MAVKPEGEKGGWNPIYLLLLLPLAVLWVPFYNRLEPTLFGFPFFYWYQLAWILGAMVITAIVYYATEKH